MSQAGRKDSGSQIRAVGPQLVYALDISYSYTVQLYVYLNKISFWIHMLGHEHCVSISCVHFSQSV